MKELKEKIRIKSIQSQHSNKPSFAQIMREFQTPIFISVPQNKRNNNDRLETDSRRINLHELEEKTEVEVKEVKEEEEKEEEEKEEEEENDELIDFQDGFDVIDLDEDERYYDGDEDLDE
jgi:hypothetical protein